MTAAASRCSNQERFLCNVRVVHTTVSTYESKMFKGRFEAVYDTRAIPM
jgi:hypothetical protein